MNNHEALKKIDEIHQIIRQSLLVIIPGTLLIAIGISITCIPFIEYGFSLSIDPLLRSAGGNFPIIFILRTIFYWTLFAYLSKAFHSQKKLIHPAVKKAWGFNDYFPLIPITTAGMLALSGYTSLCMPIVLILVGCFWGLIGRFTSPVISLLAAVNITLGIGSIYLTKIGIPYLWVYLLVSQGLSYLLAGIVLRAYQAPN